MAGFVPCRGAGGLGVGMEWGDAVYEMSINPVMKQGIGLRVSVVYVVKIA